MSWDGLQLPEYQALPQLKPETLTEPIEAPSAWVSASIDHLFEHLSR